MVVVAKGNAELVGERAFLDAANQDIRAFLLHEGFKLCRVGIVQNDGAGVNEA